MTETNLLHLQESDAPALFGLVDTNRKRLGKFWWEKGTQSALDSRRFIIAANEQEAIGSRHPTGITRGIYEDETLIGVASIHSVEWDIGRAALGYWIDAGHDGKGHATRTARGLAEIAFNELGLREISISPRASNLPSRRVAEKVGFTLRAVDHEPAWHMEEGEEVPEIAHYSMTADEFTGLLERESLTEASQ